MLIIHKYYEYKYRYDKTSLSKVYNTLVFKYFVTKKKFNAIIIFNDIFKKM